MKNSTRFVWALAALALSAAAAGAQPAYWDDIGFTALQNRLGGATPTGLNVLVSQVEVGPGGGGNFKPDPAVFPTKNFSFPGGSDGGGSAHATDVGRYYYGNLSIAQGIGEGSGSIDCYNLITSGLTNGWLFEGQLNMGGPVPVVRSHRVQNHSWIGFFETAPGSGIPDDVANAQAIRRLDFTIRRDNSIVVVGVNNASDAIPRLLGNTYNGIAVGRIPDGSSVGPSTLDTVGRSKPDIVAPTPFTSYSTPVVGAAAALLIETAGADVNANRSETIKAIILSGATKDDLGATWTRVNNGSYFEPLDRRFGAGNLNIDNSHRILTAGEQNGADLALDATTGWDFDTMTDGGEVRRYFFDFSGAADIVFSATATWLRRITPTGAGADAFETSDATLSLIELRLFNANADFTLGSLIDSSVSTLDNVQHLFRTDLLGGQRYALEVRLAGMPAGQTSEDFAVAWFASFSSVPEPGSVALTFFAGAGLFAAVRRRHAKRRPAVGSKSAAA